MKGGEDQNGQEAKRKRGKRGDFPPGGARQKLRREESSPYSRWEGKEDQFYGGEGGKSGSRERKRKGTRQLYAKGGRMQKPLTSSDAKKGRVRFTFRKRNSRAVRGTPNFAE